MDIRKELNSFKKRLDKRLRGFFEREKRKALRVDKTAVGMVERLAEFTLRGGKRLRPAFLYWGYKACGGKDKKKIMTACIAMELTESWILILDDLIDKDKLRREKPTVHVLFEREARRRGITDREHFGRVGAILVSLLGMQFVDKLIIKSGFSEKQKLLVLNKLKKTLNEVSFGQMMDVVMGGVRGGFEEETVEKIMEYKTSRYTVELPLIWGGLLAGKKEGELSGFKRYGRYLGKAFQIRDDILGTFGDSKRTGKSVLSDIREGKKTLLALKLLKELRIVNDKSRINKFNSIWGNREVGTRELEWTRRVMRETGALDYAKERARDLARKAKELIKKESLDKKAKLFLMGMTHFMVERSE